MKQIRALADKGGHVFVGWIDRSFNNRQLSHRLGRGTMWSFAGVLISRTLTMAASILVARLVGKSDFGQAGIIQSTVLMLTSFAGFGSGMMATKFVAEYARHNPEKAGRIIFMADLITVAFSLIFSLAFFVFSGPIASKALAAPEIEPLLKISSALLFFSALSGTQTGILTGFEAFRAIAKINLITGIISAILMPVGALYAGLEGVVWAMTIAAILTWVINQLVLRRLYKKNNIHYHYGFHTAEFKLMWNFNFPTVLSGLAFTGTGWVCNAMLVNATGYGEMGVINATNNWYTLILFFPLLISRIAFPVMSERLGINERAETFKLVGFLVKISAISILPFVVIISVFSPFFMSLFGSSFRASWLPLVLTLITGWMVATQIPVGNLIAAKSRMWMGFFMNLGWSFFFILFNYLFISHGATGLVLARFLAYAVHSLWTFGWLFRVTNDSNDE